MQKTQSKLVFILCLVWQTKRKIRQKIVFAGCFFLCLAGCAPRSLDDFQAQAESVCRVLVNELRKIETYEDLIKAEPYLRRCFDQLVDVLIEAGEYQLKHPEEVSTQLNAYEETLLQEMMRVYRLEGGREIVERAQREALIRLDAHTRTGSSKEPRHSEKGLK